MAKPKSHKGLLKRIRITALGKVTFKGANSGHLRSHKTGKQLMSYRRKNVAKAGDMRRLQRILHRRLKPVGYQPEKPVVAAEGSPVAVA